VAINGAVEVDLIGTICSESYGDAMRSGTGGQLDFVIGAYWSEGGRAINTLHSTAKGGTVSRITHRALPDEGVQGDRAQALRAVYNHRVGNR